jgi:hypothetical protein
MRGSPILNSRGKKPGSLDTPTVPSGNEGLRAAFLDVGQALEGLHSSARLLLVALVSAAGFCLVVNTAWNATPDAALYLALGESLARGDGYVFNGELHSFVPPGYPLLVAAAARLFGEGFGVYRVLMALLGFLSVGSAYLFLRKGWGADVAFAVGGLFAVNHVLLHNATMTLADVPFAFFTFCGLIALLCAGNRSNRAISAIVAGLLMGTLPLIRINGLGIPVAGAFFLFCSLRDMGAVRRVCLVALFLALAFAPTLLWQAWKASFPVSVSEGSYATMILGRGGWYQISLMLTALWDYASETTYALSGLVIKTGFLEMVLPLLTVAGAVSAWRAGDRLLVPLVGIQFMGLLLSPAGSRYLIFLLPALYLFLALGLIRTAGWISRRLGRPKGPGRVLIVCLCVLGVCNLGHNFKTVWNARNALEVRGAESERSLPFFKAARWLKAHEPSATVMTTNPRIIHYLSGCRTISLVRSGVPDEQAWVDDPESIGALIERTSPRFLFLDRKNRRVNDSAMEAFTRVNLRLKVIAQGSSPPRHMLYEIGPSRSRKGQAPLRTLDRCSMR